MKLDALYLTAPHGQMAAEGEKRMVVKARKFDVQGRTYWLASAGKIYGTIELEAAKPMDVAEFWRRHARHLISEDERKAWWPGETTFYGYRVVRIHRLHEPRTWHLPQGAQTFVKDVDLDVDGRDFVGGMPETLKAGPGATITNAEAKAAAATAVARETYANTMADFMAYIAKEDPTPDGVLECRACGATIPYIGTPGNTTCTKCGGQATNWTLYQLEHPESDADAARKLGIMLRAMGCEVVTADRHTEDAKAEEFGDGMTLDLLYLVEPFAGMVYSGEKTVLLKAKPFEIEDKPYWMASTRVYGITKWGNQRKINMDQFRDLRLKHRATEAQRRRWWPDKAELWAYDLKSMRRLREPREWWDDRVRGNRVIVNDVTLPVTGKDFLPDGTKPKTGLLAQITAEELRDISDKDLLAKRLRMHQLWSTTGGNVRGLTRQGFIEKHALVVKEMKRRGLERRTISDLDRATNRVLKAEGLKWIRAACEQAPDIVLAPAFVSVVGAFADGRIPNDLDVLFSADPETANAMPGIEKAVAAAIAGEAPERMPGQGMHPIWQPQGPQGPSVPMYDLVLRRRPGLELRPGPFLHARALNPVQAAATFTESKTGKHIVYQAPEGTRYLVAIDYDDARIVGADTEAIPEGLRQALDTIAHPEQATLEIYWDGTTATATDILTRYGGILANLPLRERIAYLEKADLGQVRIPEWRETRPGEEFTASDGSFHIRNLEATYTEPAIATGAAQGMAESDPGAPENRGEGTHKQAADKSEANGTYMVRNEAGKTYPFVVQEHFRGLDPNESTAAAMTRIKNRTGEPLNVHTDIRFQTPGQNLVGWTLFTPATHRRPSKFLQNQGQKIQVTTKLKHPQAWLRVEGRTMKGEPGSTKNTDSIFIIKGRGRMTYGTAKDGFYEYFLRFAEPENEKLNGRWIVVRAQVKPELARGATASQGERRVWIMSRPADQRPYIDTHNQYEKKAGEVWQYEPVPGLDLPRGAKAKA